MQCNVCKQLFDPALLSEVFKHEHKDLKLAKEYYGVKVKPYCTCKSTHLCVPGDIDTARCAYCNKPPYSVWLKEKGGESGKESRSHKSK